MQTLLLDPATNDLLLDANGNIALADAPYALAQDVASACKLFQGEAYYNTAIGVPYFDSILGKFPNFPLIKALFSQAALTVPGVATAQCLIQEFDPATRQFSAQVQITGEGSDQAIPVNVTVFPVPL